MNGTHEMAEEIKDIRLIKISHFLSRISIILALTIAIMFLLEENFIESLTVITDKDNSVLNTKENVSLPQRGLSYCFDQPLSNKTFCGFKSIMPSFDMSFRRVKSSNNTVISITSDIFTAAVISSLYGENESCVLIKPVSSGVDELVFFSPDCDYIRKILLDMEEI